MPRMLFGLGFTAAGKAGCSPSPIDVITVVAFAEEDEQISEMDPLPLIRSILARLNPSWNAIESSHSSTFTTGSSSRFVARDARWTLPATEILSLDARPPPRLENGSV